MKLVHLWLLFSGSLPPLLVHGVDVSYVLTVSPPAALSESTITTQTNVRVYLKYQTQPVIEFKNRYILLYMGRWGISLHEYRPE